MKRPTIASPMRCLYRNRTAMSSLVLQRRFALSVRLAVSSDRFRTSMSRASETRSPLLKHQQLRLRTGRCSDDGVYLVGFEIFRYALLALGSCASCVWGSRSWGLRRREIAVVVSVVKARLLR